MILVLLSILIIFYNIFISYKNIKIEKFTLDSEYFNSIVDQIYVINMDKDTNRLKILDKKLKKLNLTYKRITGIDGKKIYPYYKNKTKLRPGQLGCLLSHINVIKNAIKNNYNNILVLEDDIVFHKNFHGEFIKKYKKLIKNENKFDLIYLGCSQSMRDNGKWNNTIMKDEYYINYGTDGTFGMLINKNIFSKIIEDNKNIKIPIDTSLTNNILATKKYKCFTLYPHLITSKVDEISNTDNRKRNLNAYLVYNKLKYEDYDFS